jgi:DNA-binding LacI/PurR family transcriptional regulator
VAVAHTYSSARCAREEGWPPVGRVTLQTVAERVGVSRMTVSNAFSRPDQLSADLRERILQVADELGYVGPDPIARALVRGTSGAVGIVLTESLQYAFADEIATAFLGAVADRLAPTGLALTLLPSQGRGDVVPARDVAVDGALIYSCEPTSPSTAWLRRRGLPVVFVDQAPVPGTVCINVDDRAGAREAAQHLLDLGHRSIAVFTVGHGGEHGLIEAPLDQPDGHAARARLLGWHDALTPAGVQPATYRISTNTAETARAAARDLLTQAAPSAVLCFSDVLAHGTCLAAQDLGLEVPRQLSIVGFDDSQLSRSVRPSLTTVRQDVEAKGRAAADALLVALAGQPLPSPEHLLMPTELVARESTGPAPTRTRRPRHVRR